MEDLLTTMLQAIVEKPDAISVKKEVDPEDENRIIYYIECDPSDRGLIIGKGGRNITAIRTIAKIKAVKDKVFVTIKLKEE